MLGLTLHSGNRLETLASKLAETLDTPPASPMKPEIIVVQSRGMERWVSLQLARRHGICANYRFPFPNAFVLELFRQVFPEPPDSSPFDPDLMTWKIMEILPARLDRPGFESLRAYTGDAPGGLKQLQLCRRIADTFDQYLLFRPAMIFEWESGKESHWQAQLWRELVRSCGAGHRAAMGKAFFRALDASEVPASRLPERISVFGISALPRFHMEVLAGIARFSEVNLFLMNPCTQYWGDILSDWEAKRAEPGPTAAHVVMEDLHLEKGNRLLSSMGALGRDFFDLLNEFPCQEAACFEEPDQNTLLGCMQSDILHLRDRGGERDGKTAMDPGDDSIRIHACHGPMREMEILRDQLLQMFEADPELLPGDILVMTPDIEAYSPYIQAVFDIPGNDARRIPFSIADRSVRGESELVRALLSILDLSGGRFGATEVLAVLECGAVRRRFGLGEADLDAIRRWVKETRIRWGIDESSRSRRGMPPFAQNTWSSGMDRLLLGYAVPGGGTRMVGGIVPYDPVEGEQGKAVGRLAHFVETLASTTSAMESPRTLDEWADALGALIRHFFEPDGDSEDALRVIRSALEDLRKAQRVAGYRERIDTRAVRWHLRRTLEQQGLGFGFLTGGVTFCAMLPMRSIPFKVICLAGLNHDAYPRRSKPVGFDLMARHPLPGDRSRRNDDRYLFLEALLSARERLYISYVGRSIQDNSPIPPSVLVSELMDAVQEGFYVPGGSIREGIHVTHRLQAFSRAYFSGDGRLASYSEENCRAARQILLPRSGPLPFIDEALPPPELAWKSVALDDLCGFFGNPSRFLLSRRLRVRLEAGDSVPEDREAFVLAGLEKYALENELVEWRLKGLDLSERYSVEQASGRLPYGTVGRCAYEQVTEGVERFCRNLGPLVREGALEPVDVALPVSEFTVTGRIGGLYRRGRVHYRYGRIRPRDRLSAWIHHLALNCAVPKDCPPTTVLAGLDPEAKTDPEWLAVEYAPTVESRELLERLLAIYWAGLQRPLHFFPEASWRYIQQLRVKKAPPEKALETARARWAGGEFTRGEREDPYYELCFRDADPIDAEFRQTAEAVFEPMLRFLREIREE